MSELIAKKRVTVIREGRKGAAGDDVVVEAPLTIRLNGEELVTLRCTPEKRESLALGFLHSAGVLASYSDVAGMFLCEDGKTVEVELKNKDMPAGKVYGGAAGVPGCANGSSISDSLGTLSGCPREGDAVSLSAEMIYSLMGELQKRAVLFRATGGAHSAALAGSGKILLFCEDISRHNAVDKIIGECLRQGICMDDKALLCSCRPSYGILFKAAGLRLPLLISRSAPSTLSIELAERLNITLVGFVRGRRMNIYTHPRRVTE